MAPQIVPDPALAQPWQKLYDDASNATYYWNPDTNVTTYQRPEPEPQAPPPVSDSTCS
jgi:ATP-dependent RNA helicase DDX5/DBP2